jgi:tRNA A37 threonylcarbamoyladenosine synthetase subunit TsaC/SUA5/YrdC
MKTTLELDARRIYDLLADGGLALARTNTGYGLVAMKSQAVRRIYELKGRPAQKPCVTVGTMPILDDVATGIDSDVRAWLSNAVNRWPVAVITKTNRFSRLVRNFEPFVASQCTKLDTIATFFGVGELFATAAGMAYAHGQLIVGSSANLAGSGNNYTLDEVPDSIRNAVDLEIDYGPAPFQSDKKLASTILDLTTETFQRQGVGFMEVRCLGAQETRSGVETLARRDHGMTISATRTRRAGGDWGATSAVKSIHVPNARARRATASRGSSSARSAASSAVRSGSVLRFALRRKETTMASASLSRGAFVRRLEREQRFGRNATFDVLPRVFHSSVRSRTRSASA